jgi:hypothetical protein
MTNPAVLAQLEQSCTHAQALEFFDSLPPIRSEDLTGRWQGRGLNTAHPMDGLLESSGWYGKQFDDTESVHPLLFEVAGEIFPVEPQAAVPLDVTKRAHKYRARLRNVENRGVVSAAMVYDGQPIIDHFRRVDAHTILGLMDARGMKVPYFFILSKDEVSR